MRSEAVWLVQLLVSVCLLAGAFAVGWWVGRTRTRGADVGWDSMPATVEVSLQARRGDLFAPEVDLRGDSAVARGEIASG